MYENIASVNARIEDAVAGSRVVQSFTNETYEKNRFDENNNIFRETKTHAYKIMAFVSANIYMLMLFMTLFVFMYGAWLTYYIDMTYGLLVAYIFVMYILLK